MKIALNITVEIDPADWRAELLLNPGDDVREDVRQYFLNQVQCVLGGHFGEDNASAHLTR